MATFNFSEFRTLKQLQNTFKTEADCIKFLENKLWENGVPVSPFDQPQKYISVAMAYTVVKTLARTSISRKVHSWKALKFL